jgi:hypothetical protein
MTVCSTPPGAKWPANMWGVYGSAALGGDPLWGCRRSITCANDGGRWTFEQFGEPYPFERVENYQLPRKRDRFTRELLVEYLTTFNLFPFADSFYAVSHASPAVILEQISRWDRKPVEFTLAEVAAGIPWIRR